MIADTLLLLSLRWQLTWNSFRIRSPLRKLFLILGLLAIGLLIGGVSATIGYALGALLRHSPQLQLESLMPGLVLTAAALLLLVVAFGVVLGSLLLSSDLELLMNAPVSRRAVFITKILDGMATYYLFLLVAAAPALATYGFGLGYGPMYYVLALIVLLGTPLLPAGLAALLVMLVARFVPARRLREALGLMAALFGLSGSLIGNTSRLWGREAASAGEGLGAILSQMQQVASLPLPSLVAGRGLAAAGRGDGWGALAAISGFLLLTFGLFAACVLVADQLYAAGWVRLQSSGSGNRSAARAAQQAARGGLLSEAPAYLAIVLKDWRVFTRDLRNFAKLLGPLFILPLVYLNLVSGGGRGSGAVGEASASLPGGLDPVNLLIPAGVLATATLTFSGAAAVGISMEGRSWWLLKCSPISGRELLLGKFLAAQIPFAILATVMMIGAAVWRHFSLVGFLYGWFGVMLLGAGAMAVETGLAVPWARLDWDDPRRMGSWGRLPASIGSLLLCLVGGVFLSLPYVAHALFPSKQIVAWVAGPLGAVALTMAVGGLALRFGLNRLPTVGDG